MYGKVKCSNSMITVRKWCEPESARKTPNTEIDERIIACEYAATFINFEPHGGSVIIEIVDTQSLFLVTHLPSKENEFICYKIDEAKAKKIMSKYLN